MPFPGPTLAETRKILSLDAPPSDNEVLRNTPVLLEHCADDPLVPVRMGHALRDTLRRFGAQVEWVEYPDGGHWFNSRAGVDDVVRFLNKYLVGITSVKRDSLTRAPADPGVMDLS